MDNLPNGMGSRNMLDDLRPRIDPHKETKGIYLITFMKSKHTTLLIITPEELNLEDCMFGTPSLGPPQSTDWYECMDTKRQKFFDI